MKSAYLQAVVEAAVKAHQNPIPCNMFVKRCDLLTCHTKRRCLWTRDEGQAAAYLCTPALYGDVNQLNSPIK